MLLDKNISPYNENIFYNLIRPDLQNDVDFDVWIDIHNYVKVCNYTIFVSSAFYMVDEYLKDRQGYGGGGFRYMFWFNSEEDKQKFIDNVFTIIVGHGWSPQWWKELPNGYDQGLVSKCSKDRNSVIELFNKVAERLKRLNLEIKEGV